MGVDTGCKFRKKRREDGTYECCYKPGDEKSLITGRVYRRDGDPELRIFQIIPGADVRINCTARGSRTAKDCMKDVRAVERFQERRS